MKTRKDAGPSPQWVVLEGSTEVRYRDDAELQDAFRGRDFEDEVLEAIEYVRRGPGEPGETTQGPPEAGGFEQGGQKGA
jgi:hypothetical protein